MKIKLSFLSQETKPWLYLAGLTCVLFLLLFYMRQYEPQLLPSKEKLPFILLVSSAIVTAKAIALTALVLIQERTRK